jgi:hypothetical protein
VGDDELEQLREQGRQDALELIASRAPSDPLARCAWAAGYGRVSELQTAVDAARASGHTWRVIAQALGEHPETTRNKYGGGIERMRAYRARKRGGN